MEMVILLLFVVVFFVCAKLIVRRKKAHRVPLHDDECLPALEKIDKESIFAQLYFNQEAADTGELVFVPARERPEMLFQMKYIHFWNPNYRPTGIGPESPLPHEHEREYVELQERFCEVIRRFCEDEEIDAQLQLLCEKHRKSRQLHPQLTTYEYQEIVLELYSAASRHLAELERIRAERTKRNHALLKNRPSRM